MTGQIPIMANTNNNVSIHSSSTNNNNNNIRILSWNAGSLPAHGAELKHYIDEVDPKPQILCIQETWLQDTSTYNIPGYNKEVKCRKDRKGGGVATFIQQSIPYERLLNIPNEIEGITIKVKLIDTDVTITNLYIPPAHPTDAEVLKPIFKVNNLILCGDLNAKNTLWGSTGNDARGRLLEEILDEANATVLNTGAGTRLGRDGTYSHIDVAFATGRIAMKSQWSLLEDDEWGSDHRPTMIHIDERPAMEEEIGYKLNLKKADWSSFKDACRDNINNDVIDDTSCNYETLAAKIMDNAEKCMPRIRTGRKNDRKRVPYWNDRCTTAVKERRRMRDKMRRTRNIDDCIRYGEVKAATQKALKQESQDYWRNFCSSLNDTSKLRDVWRTSKAMTGKRSNRGIPIITDNNTKYVTNIEKANAIAKCLEKNSSDINFPDAFRRNKGQFEEERRRKEEEMVEANQELNEDFVYHELDTALRGCKRNKAPGEDNIQYEILLNLPKCSKKVILRLFNQIWSRGELPKAWKHAIVLPFLKESKEPTDPNSYRPIALTITLCKLMERLITTRLTWHIETNHLFNIDQAGFRKGRTTIDQVMRLQNDVTQSLNNNKYTVAIFLDLKKAFDMVWTTGILEKMQDLGITGRMYTWIKDFLSNRTFQVKVEGHLSDIHKLENGTPQGSVISPILFLIAINDFPELDNGVKKSIFADDSAIWKSGGSLDQLTKQVQKAMDRIGEWTQRWGFNLSTEKTIGIVFCAPKKPDQTTILLEGKQIKFETHTKFLGMVMDNRLTWRRHIEHVEKKCKQVLNLLRCISGQTWGADKTTMLMIYRAFIRPRLDYGSIAYNSATDGLKKRLEAIQMSALRISCGAMKGTSNAAIQVECGEMPLDLRRLNQSLKYASKISANGDHPTNEILRHTIRSRKVRATRTTFLATIDPHNDQLIKVGSMDPSITPPWHRVKLQTNTDLHQQISKRTTSADEMKTRGAGAHPETGRLRHLDLHRWIGGMNMARSEQHSTSRDPVSTEYSDSPTTPRS